MGCHRKHSRTRVPRRLVRAAAPALAGVAGVAAAFCLSPQALADTPAAQPGVHHATVADTAGLGPQLFSVIEQAIQHQAGSGQPSWYTVRPGDSLSAIAGRVYHNQDAWPVLYWANRSRIHWADLIESGQVLRIPVKPARTPHAPAQTGPTAAPASQAGAAFATTPATAPGTAAVSAGSYTGGTPGGSFGQCVIARESGGQAQVMNGTGHYGLYQFSASTWAAYGGSPADFGNASVAEQNRVFANALAAGGQSNWSAYDGC